MFVANLLIRRGELNHVPPTAALALSFIAIGFALVSGWLGGELGRTARHRRRGQCGCQRSELAAAAGRRRAARSPSHAGSGRTLDTFG
jgi:hypothetical protein